MAISDIRIYPDHILTQKAGPVNDINDSIRQLLQDMADTMYAASGIGLAAPQVGRSIRAIVVDTSPAVEGEKLIKLVNPVIRLAEGSSAGEEGCLSLPGVSETVTRADKIVVEAYDEDGSPVTIETDAFLATVLQHEIDHLDGILFIDHLSRLKRSVIKRKLLKASSRKPRTPEMTKKIIAAYTKIMAYCTQYTISFARQDVRPYMSTEEWWFERFGDDPVWGCGSSRRSS